MAKKKKKRKKRQYKLVRKNFGWYKRRFGILLDPLFPQQRVFLSENKFLRDIVDDDQTVHVLFKIIEMEQQNKRSRKWWYNPFTEKIGTYREVLTSSNFIDWKCATCSIPIKCSIENFAPSNFLCKDCSKIYLKDRKIIDERIVNSSIKFTNYCKKLLKKEQRTFLFYVNRNRTRE